MDALRFQPVDADNMALYMLLTRQALWLRLVNAFGNDPLA